MNENVNKIELYYGTSRILHDLVKFIDSLDDYPNHLKIIEEQEKLVIEQLHLKEDEFLNNYMMGLISLDELPSYIQDKMLGEYNDSEFLEIIQQYKDNEFLGWYSDSEVDIKIKYFFKQLIIGKRKLGYENEMSDLYKIEIIDNFIEITFVFLSMMVSQEDVEQFLQEKWRQSRFGIKCYIKDLPELGFIKEKKLGIRLKAFAGIGGEGYHETFATLFTPEDIQKTCSD